MKQVTRCSRCCNALVRTPAGFNSADQFFCPDRGEWVEPDDGCTFGVHGEPGRANLGETVSIETSASAYGRCEEWMRATHGPTSR